MVATEVRNAWIIVVMMGSWLADASGETRERPCIGVRVQNGGRGAEVVEVYPGFPAHAAGLEVGDEIVFLDGVRVYGSEDFIGRLQKDYRIGDHIDVVTLRKGERRVANLLLDRTPASQELFERRWLGRAAPDLPNLKPGQVSVVLFLGQRNREFGCDAACRELSDGISRLAQKAPRGLRVILVSGIVSGETLRKGKGISAVRDPSGIWHDQFRVEDEPAILIVDHDGWVRFARTGEGLSVADFRFALDRALESQNGLRI